MRIGRSNSQFITRNVYLLVVVSFDPYRYIVNSKVENESEKNVNTINKSGICLWKARVNRRGGHLNKKAPLTLCSIFNKNSLNFCL